MTLEQQIARFCQGLNSSLNTRLEAMRPSTLHDALLRAEPLAREISQDRGQQRREPTTQRADNPNYRRDNPPNHFQPRPRIYAANGQGRSVANVRCYGCNELRHYQSDSHYQSDCPNRRNQVATAYGNENPHQGRGQGQPNGNHNRGQGHGRGRIARVHGRGHGGRAYVTHAEPTLAGEVNERVILHAAIDNRGAHNQYAGI